MPLNTGSSKLGLALKTLRNHWAEAQPYWRDSVAQAFERDQMEPLELQAQAALRAIEELARVLAEAQRDCR